MTAGTDGTGTEIAVTDNGDGTFSFIVPSTGGVFVQATFGDAPEEIEDETKDETEDEAEDESDAEADEETEVDVDTKTEAITETTVTTKTDADAAPTTGDNMHMPVVVLALASLAGMVVLTKKKKA